MPELATYSCARLLQNGGSPESLTIPPFGVAPLRGRLRAVSFFLALGRRARRAREGVLAGGIVAAAPELAAFLGALARGHLDRAAGAGRGEEVALRGELEERELFLRRQRGHLLEQRRAVDRQDAFLLRQVDRLLREPAGGEQHAAADLRRAHGAAQFAHRFPAD